MGHDAKIVVVGSFITDVAAYTPSFPRDGETVTGSSVKLGPGGKSSNAATSARRAGAEVTMVTKVGRDTFAAVLHEHYQREGMTTDYVFESETAPTGSAIIEINEQTGQNRIIVIFGANAELTAAEVERAEEEIRNCDVVLTQLETSDEAVLETKRLALKHHKPIILNPAPARKIPDGLFDGLDYITPNETEAEAFSGIPVHTSEDALKAGQVLLQKGVKNVIITLGKKGAALIRKDGFQIIPTTDLKPVDTTGAGDSFNGAFAVALAEGKTQEEALKFANCAASISITRRGSAPSMATRKEIDELYARFYKE